MDLCCAEKAASRDLARAASPAGSWGGWEVGLRRDFSTERRVLNGAMFSGLDMAFTEVIGNERSSPDAEDSSAAAAAAAFGSRFVGFGGMVSVSFVSKSQAYLFANAFFCEFCAMDLVPIANTSPR